MLAHSLANESFNFGGRQPAHGPDTPRLPVQEGRRKVIAILDPSVAHMAWGHSVAPVVIDAADQHGFGFGACDRVVVALLIELGLHRVKEFTLEDGGLLAGQDLALEHDLADVEPIAQKMGERTSREGDPSDRSPGLERSHFGDDPSFTKVGHHAVETVKLHIAPKDGPNPLGLLFNHDDLAVLAGISERG